MSKKSLLVLAVVLAALIGAWWMSGREAAPGRRDTVRGRSSRPGREAARHRSRL